MQDDEWDALLQPSPETSTPPTHDADRAVGPRWSPPPAASLRPGRRRVLLALGTLPWVAAAAGVAHVRGSGPSADHGEPTSMATPTPAASSGSGRPVPAVAADPATSSAGIDASAAETDHRIAAAAVIAVQAAVRDTGSYADHVIVERITHPRPDAAVAVVAAVVLEPRGDDWSPPHVRRLAVPLRFAGPDPAPAAMPWPLPDPPPRDPPAVDRVLVDDPDAAAACIGELQRAGWSDVELVGLTSDGGWPLVAEIVAIAPTGGEPTSRDVWFEPHEDRWRLIGDTTTPTSSTDDVATPHTTAPHPTTTGEPTP